MPNTLTLSELNLNVLLPELVLIGFALLVMLADALSSEKHPALRHATPWIALAGVLVAMLDSFWLRSGDATFFQDAAILDNFALGLNLIVLTATGLVILLSAQQITKVTHQVGEYYALLLLAAAGMMMMGAAMDLITLFLALEIFSLSLYILTGLHRNSPRSTEAAMKYFLLGAFASSFFVYGAALIYAATGTTQYAAIAAMIGNGGADMAILYAGMALLLVGFGFKISLVPFHMWTPDVYQGAPTPVTAFMSVGTKAAAFAAFIRVLLIALPAQQASWGWALAILAMISMVLGNFAALREKSLKRMLAYSSIAHAGYILTGLVPGTSAGADAALFYLFAYAFMNIGAFAIILAMEKAGEDDALQNRAAGLGERQPLMAFAMALFMFSLAGVPPLAGFFGKFFIFKAAVDGGWAWLAAFAMLNSVVGAYYYLRVTVAMYFEHPDESSAPAPAARRRWTPLRVGVGLAVFFTVIIGVLPGMWVGLFESGMALLGG